MQDEEDPVAVYVKAFCSGVQEVLQLYQEHLLAIEHESMQDRSLTVQGLHQKLAIYYQMFPALIALMEQIEDQNLKGGQMLDSIFECCTSGNPILKSMFTRILFCCHKVFFHQINMWIVHGQLIDICEEFFINKMQNSGSSRAQGGVDDTQTEGPLNRTTTSVASLSNLNLVGSILTMDPEGIAEEDSADDEWNTVYTLRFSMLPISYFPGQLAEKILFIGKAVRVLQSKKTADEDKIPLSDLQAFSEALMKLQSLPEFNVLLFAKVIEQIRECIASRLWHLVVVKADLLEHLASIKNFFLISRGEFFQTFLQEARQMLALPPTSSAEYDLNKGPLLQTIVKLGYEDDPALKKFQIRLRSFSFQYRNFSSLNSLCYIGDVDLVANSVFKITSTKHSVKSGTLWHSLKQRIEDGF